MRWVWLARRGRFKFRVSVRPCRFAIDDELRKLGCETAIG